MRASLARSLVMEPDIFLFDEPFGALDEITRERLNDELLGLFQRKGFGALFITHSISEAVFLSTRVLVMSQRPGRILESFDIPFPYPRSHDLRFEPASPSCRVRSATPCGEPTERASFERANQQARSSAHRCAREQSNASCDQRVHR